MKPNRHWLLLPIGIGTLLVLAFFYFLYQSSNLLVHIKTVEGISEYQLKRNDLRVLLMEDHSAPVVTTLVTYLAGQREELNHPEEVAHLLEHMVMKSTKHYNQANGETAANALQAIGAMMNATTERDSTYYYETFPSEHVQLALNIQADRMRNTLFLEEDVEREREVVRNELENLANNQSTLLTDRLWKTAYKKHPYRHSVIGYRERARRLTAENLKNFYNDYYWPNNAVLTVIGDFDKKNILNLIKKEFGEIPKSQKPIPPFFVEEPKQTKPRMIRMETKESEERVVAAFKAPSVLSLDSYALDLLAKILASGKKSRLYPLLVDQKMCLGVEVDFSSTKDPGLFVISAQLAPETRHREIGRLILRVLEEIKTRGVSESELNRAKKQIKSEMAFARDGSFSIASYVSQAVGFGDWTIFPNYLDRINAVTSDDIKRAAQSCFVRENLTVGLLKSNQIKNRKSIKVKWPDFYSPAKNAVIASPEGTKQSENMSFPHVFSGNLDPRSRHSGMTEFRNDSRKVSLSKRIKTDTSTGMKLFSYPTSLKDVVMVDGSFEGAGRSFSSNYLLAEMVTGLLDKGTQHHTKFELAEILEDLGAGISFSTDYKRFRFRISALKEDIPIAMSIFAEMLTEPSFLKEEFDTIKAQAPERIKAKLTDPLQMGYGEFKRSLYPMSHPNYEPAPYDQLDQLNKITLEDVKKFYWEQYQFQNLKVLISGDVDSQTVTTVQKLLSKFSGGAAEIPFEAKVPPMPSQERKIFLEGKKSIEMFLGHALALHQQDPDYPAALLANHVLGGNFSARLLTRIREEKGLTYAIHSQFAGMSNDVEGHWVTDLIAVPEFADQALEETKKEILLWVREGISEKELTRTKKTMVGNHKVGLATTEGAARQILSAEEKGLGVNYLDRFSQLINSLTLEETNRAIKRYFKPGQLTTVMAGEYQKD